MATVVKGFETMNLPLTRRKFLSIVKEKKERKSEFFLEILIVGRKCRVSVLLFRSDVYVTSLPFFHCSFFGRSSVPCPGFLSSVMTD